MAPAPKRQQLVIDVLEEAFAPLMKADPVAFRGKYRKMAADPFAFYRGTACLFDHDVAIRGLSQVYLDAYLGQVHGYVDGTEDGEFALRLDNTTGVVNGVLRQAR